MGFKIDYQFCPQCKRPLTHTTEGDPHCDHCDITIYNNVAAASCVFPVRGDEVLLARRAREPYKGQYDLVGGFMKAGETPEQAAVRESKEETGQPVKLTQLLGIYPDQYGDGTHVIGIIYIGEIADGPEHASDDVAKLEWVKINDLPPAALASGFSSVVQALQDLQAWYRNQTEN